jgi:hypothetical protein
MKSAHSLHQNQKKSKESIKEYLNRNPKRKRRDKTQNKTVSKFFEGGGPNRSAAALQFKRSEIPIHRDYPNINQNKPTNIKANC